MLGRDVANSKKIADLTERHALIYFLMLPQHDGEGVVEVDDVAMLVGCGRFAIKHSWTADDMASARARFAADGLWRLFTKEDRELAEVIGWERFQRLEKIGRGSELAGISGASSAELRHDSGLEVKGSEVKGSEVKDNAAATVLWTGQDIDDETSRITQAWIRTRPEAENANGHGITFADRQQIRYAAENRLCVDWPTDEALDQRLLEVRREFAAKGYTVTAKGVLSNLQRRVTPSGPAVTPELRADEERFEAGKKRTRAVIDDLTAGFSPEEVAAALKRTGPVKVGELAQKVLAATTMKDAEP